MKSWPKRIAELQAAGLRYADMAERTGMAVSTIGDLATKRTKEPSYTYAVALIALHDAVIRKRGKRKAA